MPVDVVVWDLRGNSRSHRIALALTTGARTAGYRATVRGDGGYSHPRGDIAAFYGYQKNMPRIMADYIEAGKKVVFVDLGYWHRRQNGRWLGYHKISINARHPNAYLMNREFSAGRFERFKIPILPWRTKGNAIIVAGMSAKSAESYNLKPEQWERWAVEELRRYTKRPILYRPKPSWLQAKPIEGSELQRTTQPIGRALRDCHAIVTHHSNVAVDAILAGVPAFCWGGVAESMSLQDLSLIEEPYRPTGRAQWASNIAYCQWDVREMMTGAMWRHLKTQGLIP